MVALITDITLTTRSPVYADPYPGKEAGTLWVYLVG